MFVVGIPRSVNWTFATGDSITSSPAIDIDGSIYVGSEDDNMYKLDHVTGQQVWKFVTQGSVDSSPALWNNLLIFGSGDYSVYAVDKNTGAKVWSYATQVSGA